MICRKRRKTRETTITDSIMGCRSSKQNTLNTMNDSEHSMLKHDKKPSISSQTMSFVEIDWESASDDEYEYEHTEEEEEEEEEEEAKEGSKPLVTVEPTTLCRTVTTTADDDMSFSSSSMMVSSIDEAICSHCGRETHAPVDCETLRNWHTADTTEAVVIVMPSLLLSACLPGLVQHVATLWNIPPSAAAILLYDVNWDASQLTSPSMYERQTNFVEMERASGVTERCRAHRGTASGRPVEQAEICNICLETDIPFDQMVSMPCGHAYCRECWVDFFIKTVEITDPTVSRCLRMTCPESECNERVTEEEIRKVAPELLVHFESQQFSAFLDSIRGGTYARSCPGHECTFIAIQSQQHRLGNIGRAVIPVSCDGCHTQFCFRCGEAPHDNECRIVDERPKSVGGLKTCPRCRVRIEKNGGCNHMTCRCGHQFCWLCMEASRHHCFCGREQPNVEHGRLGERDDLAELFGLDDDRVFISAHDMPSFDLEYVCGTLAEETRNQETRVDEQWPEDASLVLQKKREMVLLAHLAHCRARYAAHDQGQQYTARRSEDIAAQIQAFHQLPDNFSGTYADFLVIANERLVILRRVLKYSYILAYYLPEESESNRTQKHLFQYRLEMLDRFTEELSRVSENASSHLDRANVVNLMGIVEKCSINLLHGMS